MVHILVTAKYPSHKGNELVELYLSGKAAKYPDFVKRIHGWVVMDYGAKNYAVYEVPDDKLYEGIKAIAKRYSTYTTVEGYKYKIEPLLEITEAIQLVRE